LKLNNADHISFSITIDNCRKQQEYDETPTKMLLVVKFLNRNIFGRAGKCIPIVSSYRT